MTDGSPRLKVGRLESRTRGLIEDDKVLRRSKNLGAGNLAQARIASPDIARELAR
jgi:hypothetical protein